MINFVLPGFYRYNTLNTTLLSLIREKSEMFYEDINISAVYDCFPAQIWNGGRYCGSIPISTSVMKSIVNYYNSQGVSCRFTYTNSLLTELDCKNVYCNTITRLFDNGKNEILVNSVILERWLKGHYDNYRYISSITRCLTNKQSVKSELYKDYFLVVLDYRHNKDFQFLESIEDKSKVEILLNESCNPLCRFRKEHYDSISKSQLEKKPNFYSCHTPNTGNTFFDSKTYSTFISVEDLYGKYVPMGFTTYKIMGRGINELDVIESYVYYLVKSEYRDFVRYVLNKKCLTEIVKNQEGSYESY